MAGKHAGRHGGRWRKLTNEVRNRRDPCGICGQPINYEATYPHPDSFTVDHIKSWIAHPELREDPANLRAACARCNKAKGMKDDRPTLGNLSEQW